MIGTHHMATEFALGGRATRKGSAVCMGCSQYGIRRLQGVHDPEAAIDIARGLGRRFR